MTVLDDGIGCLEHEAFVYADDAEYVGTLLPLILDTVAAGRPVIAVVPAHCSALLRAASDDAAGAVRWIDAGQWYRHPIRTIAAYEDTLRRLGSDAGALVIGEVQFGETERDWLAWTRYEAALNRALRRHAVRIVCPYDARALPAVVVEDARRTHRHVLGRHGRRASDAYVEPGALLHALARPVDVPTAPPDVELAVAASIREGRQAFRSAAEGQGLPASRIDPLSVAVSEVLTNAVVHGGGAARFRIWRRDGGLTCVVEDTGTGSDDPLLGYVPPLPGAIGGYGLWLTRQLFDRTELGRSPDGGLVVLLDIDTAP